VGPGAILGAVVKRKIPSPCRESNPRTPIIQPVAQRYTDCATTALNKWEDDIKMDVEEMGAEGVEGFQLAQDKIQ
jgi:hypothetical protein